MLVPTKIDLTVDAERHKTFKVPPFLQALEHSSDCERSSQRVEKKSSISSIKNTGKAQTPSPPNGHARFWVNEEIWARSPECSVIAHNRNLNAPKICKITASSDKGKGKGILFNVGGQTGKDCLLTWADGV